MPEYNIDVSLIIASYNTVDLLRDCIRSIYASTGRVSFEVIVIDDCSKDGSPEMVEREFPRVRLVRNDTNLRYAKVNNKGLDLSKARYAVLLNSDTVIQNHAFDILVEFMDSHPDAAAAGPKLINLDGSIQHCIRGFPDLGPMFFQSLNLHKVWPSNPITNQYYHLAFDYDKTQPVEDKSIGTTAFIIRRSTWENHGKLDERFPHFFVDQAYCYVLCQAGLRMYYVAEAEVMHIGSQSINQNGEKEIRRLHDALKDFYELYYAPKHGSIKRFIARYGIPMRKRLKLLEYRFSSDKRVLSGPKMSPPKPKLKPKPAEPSQQTPQETRT